MGFLDKINYSMIEYNVLMPKLRKLVQAMRRCGRSNIHIVASFLGHPVRSLHIVKTGLLAHNR